MYQVFSVHGGIKHGNIRLFQPWLMMTLCLMYAYAQMNLPLCMWRRRVEHMREPYPAKPGPTWLHEHAENPEGGGSEERQARDEPCGPGSMQKQACQQWPAASMHPLAACSRAISSCSGQVHKTASLLKHWWHACDCEITCCSHGKPFISGADRSKGHQLINDGAQYIQALPCLAHPMLA